MRHNELGLREPSIKEPRLGYATTKELIDELAARADVSKTVGETWPDYKTVDGDEVPTNGTVEVGL